MTNTASPEDAPSLPPRAAAPELAQPLVEALRDSGPGYEPRTHHLDVGAPRFTNRLILESSPHLLQHAHNPVDWYA